MPFRCMQQPLSVCSSLKGRNSDYITPHNIPLNVSIDNRSLDFTNVLLQNLLHHTNTLQICYELYIHLLPYRHAKTQHLHLCFYVLRLAELTKIYSQLVPVTATALPQLMWQKQEFLILKLLTATILQVTSTMVSLSPRTHAQTYLGQKAKVKLYGYNCFLKSLCVSAEILLDKKTLFR